MQAETPSGAARGGGRVGQLAGRAADQHRALDHADLPRRRVLRAEPVLRHGRQSRQRAAPGLDHRDHRHRPHLRHPHRRDRPVGGGGRQRRRHRGGLLHAAGILRQHRQPAAAGLRRGHPGAARLRGPGGGHRLRRHHDRHPVLHHDPGHAADRRRHLRHAGARPDRLRRAAGRSRRWARARSGRSRGSSWSRPCSCSSATSC